MSSRLEMAVSTCIAVAALAVGGVAIAQWLEARSDRREELRYIPNWQDALPISRTYSGSSEAQVKILMISDYQCPACAGNHHRYEEVIERFGDSLEWRYVHYPLSYHSRALELALASECAAEYGGFRAFTRAAFARQEALDTISIDDLIRSSGMDQPDDVLACSRRGMFSARVVPNSCTSWATMETASRMLDTVSARRSCPSMRTAPASGS